MVTENIIQSEFHFVMNEQNSILTDFQCLFELSEYSSGVNYKHLELEPILLILMV